MLVTGDNLCDRYTEGSVSREGWSVLSTQYFPMLCHYYLHSFVLIIYPCICLILKDVVKLFKNYEYNRRIGRCTEHKCRNQEIIKYQETEQDEDLGNPSCAPLLLL